MANLKKDLDALKEKNEILKSIIFINYNTIEEINENRKKNKDSFDEYYNNLKKIEELEWELMTPEERERKLEVAKKIRAKTSGN